MRTEDCRRWRTSLGAHALGQLPNEERAGLEAHLEGCAECRAEAASLGAVARMLPHADPARFEAAAPSPPAALGERVAGAIGSERRARRRQHGLVAAFGTAAAAAAVVMAALLLPLGGEDGPPVQHVSFGGLPGEMKIAASLEPRAYGTEIHMYVKGVRSGTLCRVFLQGPDGVRYSAGTFRYRWGEDSNAVLSSALDISRTRAIGVEAGGHTFMAPVSEEQGET